MKWWQILLDVVAALWVLVCAFFGYMAYALSATWDKALIVSAIAALVLMSPSLVWFVRSTRKGGMARIAIAAGTIIIALGLLVFNNR